jgi:hypothetical protein
MENKLEAPENDIVSFNQALELCSLEFDIATLCMYEIENRQLCLCYIDENGLYMPNKDFFAPTKGQVFKWFRNKCNFLYNIFPLQISASTKTGYRFSWEIYNYTPEWLEVDESLLGSLTYEEAENACIDKMIELAKQQKK